ncbi:MAG: tetratricopeptide repeat protein [Blastocatellia bacterium]
MLARLTHPAFAPLAACYRRARFHELARVLVLGFAVLALTSCGSGSSSLPPPIPPAAPLASNYDSTESAIRFLEDRLKRDPDDIIAYNKLAGYYLQRLRETGSLNYLDLASRAAHASLKAVSAEIGNTGGLAALAQVEFASHEFALSRDHAKELIKRDPGKSYPCQILGDSLLELGDYDGAAAIFQLMERRLDGSVSGVVAVEVRRARLAELRGETGAAQKHRSIALMHALDLNPAPRELVAWCRWQLGETSFSIGDYETAERHYRDALITFPDYYRAIASLGRARAAQGDLPGAIEQYEHAIRILPDPAFVAALGDVYQLAGREKEAAAQYALVEHIARLGTLGGSLYNRQLALFYADHDIKTEDAYANALREYEARRDIYGADIVAWAALKAGKLSEAQTAIKEALRLGTRDARLFYHAGVISRASGDLASARDYLERALKLNPQFDPMQALNARKALDIIAGFRVPSS